MRELNRMPQQPGILESPRVFEHSRNPAVLPAVVIAEAVAKGLTVCEYAPGSASHAEFEALARAVEHTIKR